MCDVRAVVDHVAVKNDCGIVSQANHSARQVVDSTVYIRHAAAEDHSAKVGPASDGGKLSLARIHTTGLIDDRIADETAVAVVDLAVGVDRRKVDYGHPVMGGLKHLLIGLASKNFAWRGGRVMEDLIEILTAAACAQVEA